MTTASAAGTGAPEPASRAFLVRLPKVELHCHFLGSVRPATVAELAAANGVELPVDVAELYGRIESAPLVGPEYEHTMVPLPDADQARGHFGGYGLLQASAWVMAALVRREDFARAAYESQQDAHRTSNVRYREMFFEPAAFMSLGISYATVVDGLLDGMRTAETDLGVAGRLIAGIDRAEPPGAARELVGEMLATHRDDVIGIGLEGSERAGAPELFAEAFALAGRGGLRRCAHAGEHVPSATNVLTCLDMLNCDRVDHGYFVLEDPEAVARCSRDGVYFTCAFTTSRRAWIPWRRESVRRMIDAGLRVTLGSDDPAMFPTTLGLEYLEAHEKIGLPLDAVVRLAANGIEASWMSDDEKARHRDELARSCLELRRELGLVGWGSG